MGFGSPTPFQAPIPGQQPAPQQPQLPSLSPRQQFVANNASQQPTFDPSTLGPFAAGVYQSMTGSGGGNQDPFKMVGQNVTNTINTVQNNPYSDPSSPQSIAQSATQSAIDAAQNINDPNNLNTPGAAENIFPSVQEALQSPFMSMSYANGALPQLGQPGAFEQYWNGVSGRFNANPNASNDAQAAYEDYLKNRPNIAAQPDLGAFYSDAEKRATDTLNANAAARGNYGSSVALNGVGSAIAGLEADRAKNEANYQLARDQAINQQEQLGGQLGSAADISSRGNVGLGLQNLGLGGTLAGGAENAGLSRLLGGGQLANSVDTQALSRILGGESAANTAEGAQQSRIQQELMSVLMPYQMLSGMAGNTYGNIFSGDQSNFENMVGAPVAAASNASAAQSQAQAGQIGLAQVIYSMLTGRGGGGGAAPAPTG